jgi:hypothetical protein
MMTFDSLIDAEAEAEAKIRCVLLDLEAKTGLSLNYVRVVCAPLEVDVSLKVRQPAATEPK